MGGGEGGGGGGGTSVPIGSGTGSVPRRYPFPHLAKGLQCGLQGPAPCSFLPHLYLRLVCALPCPLSLTARDRVLAKHRQRTLDSCLLPAPA